MISWAEIVVPFVTAVVTWACGIYILFEVLV